MFGDIGRQVQSGLFQQRLGEQQAFGTNVPTGFGAKMRAALATGAPYGQANLAATESGQRQMRMLGDAAKNLGMSRMQYFLPMYETALKKKAIQAQIALGMLSGQEGSPF